MLVPLLIFKDGRPLSCQRFVVAVLQALESAVVQASEYVGHSFWIGAAMTFAAQGMEDSTIKTLTLWKASKKRYDHFYAIGRFLGQEGI